MIIQDEKIFIEKLKLLDDIKELIKVYPSEPEELTTSINDIYESATEIVNIIKEFQKSSLSLDEIKDLLENFYSEIKHIEYHINKSAYLKSGSVI